MEPIDFKLNDDSYAGFDASTLRQLIISNLKNSDVFKDANFEGSNISSIISMIAYSNHMLLWYLNNTSAESNFSYASLYENVNKLVKILNYNPIGRQTAILNFKAVATGNLAIGSYIIPRFSYINKNGITYSIKNNVSIIKTVEGTEDLTSFSESNTLYQGVFKLYPIVTTVGENYEVINLGIQNSDVKIDHGTITVFVKEPNNKWEEYKTVDSIYTESNDSKCFEPRYNEYGRYEIKFGNNINGYKPTAGSEVAIYYLQSDGVDGEVDAGAIDGANLIINSNNTLTEIFEDTLGDFSVNMNPLTQDNASNIKFFNTLPSSKFAERESIDNIKNNAVNFYKTQYRLVTSSDYENYIKFKYSNIIASNKVVSNKEYIGPNGHLNYLRRLGLTQATKDNSVFSNQVNMSDSCDFNNIYIYAVPKVTNNNTSKPLYLTSAQKNAIISDISSIKYINSEPVFIDPVYIAFKLGFGSTPGAFKLLVHKNTNSFINNNTIIKQVHGQIISFFDINNNSLGQYLEFSKLTESILSINGISKIEVSNGTTSVEGLSFMYMDPIYPNVISSTDRNLPLDIFKFPYIENSAELLNSIEIV